MDSYTLYLFGYQAGAERTLKLIHFSEDWFHSADFWRGWNDARSFMDRAVG